MSPPPAGTCEIFDIEFKASGFEFDIEKLFQMKTKHFTLTLFLGLLAGSIPVWSQVPFQDAHPGLEATATGTGRTTGHIADLTLNNTTSEPMDTEIGPLVIPSDGKFQGYVVNDTYPVEIPAFGSATLPLYGYCTDIFKLALPEGAGAADAGTWISVTGPAAVPGPSWNLVSLGYELVSSWEEETIVLTYPGTTIPFTYRIDTEEHLETVGSMLVEVVNMIEESYDRWVATEEEITVFEEMTETEQRSTVVQHVFWYYTSVLRGERYDKTWLTRVITDETEIVTNTTVEHYTPITVTLIEQEVTNVWNVILLIGTDAKILKETETEEGSWGVHYQEWVLEELQGIDPRKPDAGWRLALLADTLGDLQQYLGTRYIERTQNGIAVKLGDFFKFRLGQLKTMDQWEEWQSLNELSGSTAAYLLEPGTQATIRDQLSSTAHSLGEASGQYILAGFTGLNPADPDALGQWGHLNSLVSAPWYGTYVSTEVQEEIRKGMSEKFTAFAQYQADQLDPKDTSMLVKWVQLQNLVLSDWFGEYVSETTAKEIVRILGEKLAAFLNNELDKLNPADTSMLVKWREIEILTLTDWFDEYITESVRTQIIQKLKEKFTSYLKEQITRLDPSTTTMLVEWRKLETLVQSDWFTKYVSEADKKIIIKMLKEKFTAFVKKRLEELDPKDPDFLKKWAELEALTHTDWYGEYLDDDKKPTQEMSKSYRQWEKSATGPVDYTMIDWKEVQWTGGEFKHLFTPVHAGMADKGMSPWTWVGIAAVPVTGGIVYLVWPRPEPIEAVPDALTINCPGQGTVNVLVNDEGEDLEVVSFTQPDGAVVTDIGGGNLQVVLQLVNASTGLVFSYTIKDNEGKTSTAQVAVTIALPAFQINDDTFDGFSSSGVTGNVMLNDAGAGLTIIGHTEPLNGLFSIQTDGNFSFTPNEGFCGMTDFFYVCEDQCKQTGQATVTLNIEDNQPPVLVCPPDTERECGASIDTIFTGFPHVTDNCTAFPVVDIEDVFGGEPCPQTVTRTFTATDEQGLSASCSQLILLTDEEAPQIECPSDIVIPCDIPPDPANTGLPEYSDNCTPAEEIDVDHEDQFTGTGGAGTLTRTWTVSDQCDSTAACEQVITLEDLVAPVISCPPQITISCEIPPDPANTGFPEVSDNCAAPGEMPLVFTDQFIGGGCVEDILRTWTVIDGAGNSVSCDQLIVREDLAPPVVNCPSNITVTCGQEFDPTITGTATAVDICGDVISIGFTDDLSGYIGCEGTILRTWTAVDECGNTGTCVQTIIVLPLEPCGLEVLAVIPPSGPSANDGAAFFLATGMPLMPLNIYVNGFFVGQANTMEFYLEGFPEGVFEVWYVGAAGAGCESNVVVIVMEAPPGISGLDFQPFVSNRDEPAWQEMARAVWSEDPGVSIPEHPELEPGEPVFYPMAIPIGFGLGYPLSDRLQLRWQMQYCSGRMGQNWLDPATGDVYLLETGFRAMTNDGGIRWFANPGKVSSFLGAGAQWHRLEFADGRLTESWSAYLSAGMRFDLGRKAYLELEGRMGKGNTSDFELKPELSFRF